MQLKQCRGGFYAFSNGKAIKAGTQTTFSIKSAFDRNERRAQDEQMFGYEALSAGIDMAFTVEVDDDRFSEAISKALTGLKRVGRSRSAQYGLVKIELAEDFSQAESHEAKEGDLQSVYADSRLIFIDPEGMPTTRPSVADLGFASGEIVWEKSQVRTFQYSPWNYKRQCYDADRYGIEKGSVLIVRTSAPTPKSDSDTVGSFTVGSFRNEGFGKVIFNPDFLAKSDNATNGEAKYTFPTKDKPNGNKTAKPLTTKLTKFLKKEADQEKADSDIYKKVNEFVGKNEGAFRDKEFASQWGEIRSIASGCKTKSELARRLYETADAYLTHGVAAQKWGERGRLGLLQKFVDGCAEETAPRAVIQLAAEMAKKCKR